ncbi:hypothetical protein [Streptomyces sp. NPDC091416]|uniref:hypothetical protein n=1 Tax=Streptomyces sp. NPDC091416 TaxID=3366003 RepID=UPI003804BAE9
MGRQRQGREASEELDADDLGRTALDVARARDRQSAVSTWHTVAVGMLEPAFGIRASFAELAARALAFADPDESGPFLVRQLLERRVDPLSRNEAAAALAAPDPRLRKFAAEVLWGFGADVIRDLHDKEAQQWAAGLLRAHADRERDPDVLSEVVRGVGWHAEVDSWDRESRLDAEERARLQRFAAHSDPRVRDIAELALSAGPTTPEPDGPDPAGLLRAARTVVDAGLGGRALPSRRAPAASSHRVRLFVIDLGKSRESISGKAAQGRPREWRSTYKGSSHRERTSRYGSRRS